MRKFENLFFFFIAAILLGCNDKTLPETDNGEEKNSEIEVVVSASKQAITDINGGTLFSENWSDKEELYVATLSDFKQMKFSSLPMNSGAGESSAKFKGILKTSNPNEPLYAFYGNKENLTKNTKGLIVSLNKLPLLTDISAFDGMGTYFGKFADNGNSEYKILMRYSGAILNLKLQGLPNGSSIRNLTIDNSEINSSSLYNVGGDNDNKITGTDNQPLSWTIEDGLKVENGVVSVLVQLPPASSLGLNAEIVLTMSDGKMFSSLLKGLSEIEEGRIYEVDADLTEKKVEKVTGVKFLGKYQLGEALMFVGDKQIQFGNIISPNGNCIKAYGDYVYLAWWKGGLKNRNMMLSRFNVNTKKIVTIEFPDKHIGYRGSYYLAEKEDPNADLTNLPGDSHNSIAIGICPIDGTIHLVYDLHAYTKTTLPEKYFNYRVSKKNILNVPDEDFKLDIFNEHQLKFSNEFATNTFELQTYPNFLTTDDGQMVYMFRHGGSGNGDDKLIQYDGNKWNTRTLVFNNGDQPNNKQYSIYGGMKYMNGKFSYGFHVRYAKRNQNLAYYNQGMHYAETVNPFKTDNNWQDAFGNAHQFPLQAASTIEFKPDPVNVYGSYISASPSYTETENGDLHFVTRVYKSKDEMVPKTLHYFKAKNADKFTVGEAKGIGELFSFGNSIMMVGLNSVASGNPYFATCIANTDAWEDLLTDKSISFSKSIPIMHGNKIYIFGIKSAKTNSQPIYLLEYELEFN